jgi:hypothetical protein
MMTINVLHVGDGKEDYLIEAEKEYSNDCTVLRLQQYFYKRGETAENEEKRDAH